MPQEDYAEVLHDQVGVRTSHSSLSAFSLHPHCPSPLQIMLFLKGTPEDWTKAQSKSYRMSKKGAVPN